MMRHPGHMYSLKIKCAPPGSNARLWIAPGTCISTRSEVSTTVGFAQDVRDNNLGANASAGCRGGMGTRYDRREGHHAATGGLRRWYNMDFALYSREGL